MCLKLFHSSMVSGDGSVTSPKDQTRLNMLFEVRGGVVVALARILIRSDTFKNAVKSDCPTRHHGSIRFHPDINLSTD